MVLHRQGGDEWWCLPGGGIEHGEAPDGAALRELKEECRVDGRLLKLTSMVEYGKDDCHHTYLVDIGDQTPSLGVDPEKEGGEKILVDIAWLSFRDLAERDRVYLWTAGLLAVEPFAAELLTWDREPSAPKPASDLPWKRSERISSKI